MTRVFAACGLLAAACSVPSPTLPQPNLPPPALSLEVSHVRAGEPIVLTVTGVTPGEEVYFGAGFPGSGPCIGGGVCLGIDVQRLLGTVTASAAGEATLITGDFPDVLQGRTLGLQAAIPGAGAVASDVVERTVGAWTESIDATAGPVGFGGPDPAAWVYFSFEDGLVDPASANWDLSFQRSWVASNGGVSGPGQVEVAHAGADWRSVQGVDPAWTFEVDAPDNNADGVDEYALLDWYDYDFIHHVLSPAGDVYVVHTDDDRYAKLRFTDYYSATGVSGMPAFEWAWIAGVADEAVFDASAGSAGPTPTATDWVYISLADGVVQPADPDDSDAWDLALQRTHVKTNSGTSGTGGVEVAYGGMTFDDAWSTGATWHADSASDDAVSAAGSAGSWYDYDFISHIVSPRADTYLVRATDGRTYRLQFRGYYDATGASGHLTLGWQPIPDESRP